MWSYFDKGGPVMWPLLVLSVLGVTVIFWRWWALRQATSGIVPFMKDLRDKLVNRDVPGAITVCERHRGPVAAIVKAGLLRYGRPKDEVERALQDASAHELAELERGLPVLATVAMISPLLGFLGRAAEPGRSDAAPLGHTARSSARCGRRWARSRGARSTSVRSSSSRISSSATRRDAPSGGPLALGHGRSPDDPLVRIRRRERVV